LLPPHHSNFILDTASPSSMQLAALLLLTGAGVSTALETDSANKSGGNHFRQLEGLAPKDSPDFIDEHGHSHYSLDYLVEHPQMGKTVLKYDAVVGKHCRFIDPVIDDLSCTKDGLTLHSIAEDLTAIKEFSNSLNVGDVLVGTSSFGCHTFEDSGRDHGRTLHEGEHQPIGPS
jgi:hypothetical protein